MIPPQEFIKKIKPFTFLSRDELNILMSGLEVELFKKGSVIYKRGEPRKFVYIVFSGLVGLFDDEAVDYIAKGEVFGIIASDGSPYLLTARAIEDTVCYMAPVERFREVVVRNERFSSFFTTFISRQFRSFKSIASDRTMIQESAVVLDVEKVIYRRPVTCAPGESVGNAASEMDRAKVNSIIVVDDDFKPVGILTHTDLRTVLIKGDRTSLVSDFMTSPVESIPSKTTVVEAFAKMTDLGLDHLVVLREDRLLGVITRKDILRHLQPSFSIFSLYRKINRARSIEKLKVIYESVRMSVAKITMTGPNFFDLSKMISSVYDALTGKVVQIIADELSCKDFVWVQMGSSGRREEVIATDQDNAIIHKGNDAGLSGFAEAVCGALADIGIPKCPGGYMASRPEWNRSVSDWRDRFREWFADPVPNHVRYLSVFLDMRPVYGDAAIYREMLEAVRQSVSRKAVTLLVYDAIEIQAPLGLFGIIGLPRGLDVKMVGIYPIVNGARVLALDAGILDVTNTKERLEALNREGVIGETLFHDLLESYGFLQDLRLRHHAASVLAGKKTDNIINTKQLPKVDLLILKESLKVTAAFQKFLMDKYKVTRPPMVREL